jgi:predicted dehydrogenase
MSASDDRIRIGVVGYGFGRHHVRTLANLAEAHLVAVADDARTDELARAAAQYGFTPYDSAAEMLRRESLDAISVCVSPRYRRDVLAAGAEAGVAMFVEKPWASSASHARELADVCRGSRRCVMVGFSFRFHPAIVKLRSLLDGELGPVRMLNGQYTFGWLPPPDHWTWDPDNGNGFINENSCHLLDAVCSLMGRPVRVFAEAGSFSGSPAEEAAAVTLRFAGGGVACLSCGGIGAAAFTEFPRISAATEHGQAELIGANHTWRELRWACRGDDAVRRFTSPPEQLGTTRYTHALERFCRCVRDGRGAPATVADGVLSVELAMAVVESARSGRPVTL